MLIFFCLPTKFFELLYVYVHHHVIFGMSKTSSFMKPSRTQPIMIWKLVAYNLFTIDMSEMHLQIYCNNVPTLWWQHNIATPTFNIHIYCFWVSYQNVKAEHKQGRYRSVLVQLREVFTLRFLSQNGPRHDVIST